jgi:lambda family phage portal protein
LKLTTEQWQLKAKEAKAKADIAQSKANAQIAKIRADTIKQFSNSGYSEGGASRTKKSLKGWTANSKTPLEDIDNNLNLLRQRSRDLVMNAPLATSAVKTTRTNVVGAGLKLKSKINYNFLELTQEQADIWEKNVEREFSLWADENWCDATGINNFFEMQQLAMKSWLENGDGWAIIKNVQVTEWMPYGLRLHLIEADRISTPQGTLSMPTSFYNNPDCSIGKADNGNWIYNGVEVDSFGCIVAYYVCNHYPNSNLNGTAKKWIRVESKSKKNGNPNILQLMESERCEQYRGVPFLAPVIESLKQITRYTEAELMAAVVTAFFTAFIKTEATTTEIPFGASIEEEQQVDTSDISYELGAGTINVLEPGEDVVFADPKRPSSGFDPFVTAMTKQIGAALEIPFELLTKSFMASYSASRAALLEAWKAFRMRRTWFANDFCQPIYKIWLSEGVARGRISAPGFFNDPAIKKAWCGSEWIGPSPGQIDPVKEVTASKLRVDNGFSTRERETIELTGGNWDDNINQIKKENELLSGISTFQEGGNNFNEPNE